MLTRLVHDHLPRIFIASLFILSAILFIITFNQQVDAIGTTVIGMPLALAAIVLAITIKLVCGTMILANWQVKTAASILVVFMVLATLIEHSNWGDVQLYNLLQFFKNVAIIGGLLLLARSNDHHTGEESSQ
ncbi:MAG: DoxX family protein [Candidatus Moraniibacteriota bacterium]